MILAGDIGGTSTRLAYFDILNGRLQPLISEKYASREHKGLEEIVRAFSQKHSVLVQHAAFGIAGPVRRQRAEATNLPWVIDAANMKRELNKADVYLLNDLEANTYGIFELAPSDFAVLNAGNAADPGNIAVISAGTGLGEAGAAWDSSGFVVFATEGGHTDFAPRDELEIELLLHVRQRLGGRVSYERILSGPGIYTVYQFLRDTNRYQEEPWLRDELTHGDASAIISQHGLDGKSELCAKTLDLFVTLYGAEAGNLALKMMATRASLSAAALRQKFSPKCRAACLCRHSPKRDDLKICCARFLCASC